MKVTITQEFATVEEAAAFLADAVQFGIVSPDSKLTVRGADAADKETVTDKPARKPRSDAGKARGSYKVNGEAAAPEVAATPTPPNAAAQEPSGKSPATAGNGGHEQKAPRGAAVRDVPVTAAPNAVPTKEDAHAALKRMADKKGFGTPACIQHLKEFKVNRLSELKPESYALFIKQLDDKLAA